MGLAAELLERLWRDPKARSRNANFVRYRDDARYRLAVKHVRSLLSLRGDLVRHRGRSFLAVAWLEEGKGARITLRIPGLRLRRSLFVSRPELDLLRSDPAWDGAEVVFVDGEEAPTGHDRRS